jgi:hypothetical protein
MTCERVKPAQLRALLDDSVERRLARAARVFGGNAASSSNQRDPVLATARIRRDPFELEAFSRYPTLRAMDATPVERVAQLPLRGLAERVEAAAVRNRRGGYEVPRYLRPEERPGVNFIRTPSALIIEAEAESLVGGGLVTAVRVGRDLTLAVREGLWEDLGEDAGKNRLGVVALVAFGLGSLLFCRRFYANTSVERIGFRLGILGPKGRFLWKGQNPIHFIGDQPTATTTEDLWAERDITVADLESASTRSDINFGVLSELFDYFGWEMPRATYEQFVETARADIAGDL